MLLKQERNFIHGVCEEKTIVGIGDNWGHEEERVFLDKNIHKHLFFDNLIALATKISRLYMLEIHIAMKEKQHRDANPELCNTINLDLRAERDAINFDQETSVTEEYNYVIKGGNFEYTESEKAFWNVIELAFGQN